MSEGRPFGTVVTGTSASHVVKWSVRVPKPLASYIPTSSHNVHDENGQQGASSRATHYGQMCVKVHFEVFPCAESRFSTQIALESRQEHWPPAICAYHTLCLSL